MKTVFKYLLWSVLLTSLGQGIAAEAYVESGDTAGFRVLWLLTPQLAMFFIIFVVNGWIFMPRLLMKGRYGIYGIAIFCSFFILNIPCIAAQQIIRQRIGAASLFPDGMPPWFMLNAAIISIILSLTFLSFGILTMHNWLNKECDEVNSATAKLKAYTETIAHRLDSVKIRSSLTHIIRLAKTSPEEAIDHTVALSGYLRHQLYELPPPPAQDCMSMQINNVSHITELLTSRRYHTLRHLMLSSALLTFALGTLFETPGQPVLSSANMLRAFVVFLFLALLTYSNTALIFPYFRKRGRVRSYLAAISVSLAIFTIAVTAFTMSVRHHALDNRVHTAILVSTMAGTVITLVLFVGGISCILMLQDLIRTRHCTTLLRAESARQEYVFLRKQINPHLVFNLLNDIRALIYESPAQAETFLDGLGTLIDCQLRNIHRPTTTVSENISFIRSYLTLERIRRHDFSFHIHADSGDTDTRIPSMLFIPFVENAVKYACHEDGKPDVDITVHIHDARLTFRCVNQFNPTYRRERPGGGIGISNTLRRLNLIYEEKYSYSFTQHGSTCCVILTIPI